MKARYEIEEMVTQDESGVVFRARDREEDREVAVRRFFPMDSPGSGFEAGEREAFEGTVEALKTLRHESLSVIVDGGVDEVDGIPYLVTEWPEGDSLATLLEQGPLAAEQAVAIAGQGLEVLQLLVERFGENTEWLEMEAPAVVIDAATGLCRFTIDPLQVLDVAKRDGGVRGLGYLLDMAMGWNGRVVPPGAAAGLGGWVSKARAGDWTIPEAYRELVRIRSVWTGEDVPDEPVAPATPPPPAAAPVQRQVMAAPSRVYVAPQSGNGGLIAGMVIGGILLLGLGVWLGVAQPWKGKPTVAALEEEAPDKPKQVEVVRVEPDREMTPQERVNAMMEARRRDLREPSDPEPAEEPGENPEPVVRTPTTPERDRPAPEEEDPEPTMPSVFGPDDGEKMRDWIGEEAVVEGELFRVRDSNSGKTRYLEFSDEVGQDVLCVRCWPSDDLSLESLKALEGKTLRFSGKIAVEAGTGRILLHIKERSQIAEVE